VRRKSKEKKKPVQRKKQEEGSGPDWAHYQGEEYEKYTYKERRPAGRVSAPRREKKTHGGGIGVT